MLTKKANSLRSQINKILVYPELEKEGAEESGEENEFELELGRGKDPELELGRINEVELEAGREPEPGREKD